MATRLFHAIVLVGIGAAEPLTLGCGGAPGVFEPDDAAASALISGDAGTPDAMVMDVDGEAARSREKLGVGSSTLQRSLDALAATA